MTAVEGVAVFALVFFGALAFDVLFGRAAGNAYSVGFVVAALFVLGRLERLRR